MAFHRSRFGIGKGAGVCTGVDACFLIILHAVAWLCLTSPPARAAVWVSGPCSLPAAATSYSGAQIQVQQFDPSLGTLDSVSIVAQGTGKFTQFFENMGPSAGQLIIGQSLHMVLDLPDESTPILSMNQSENHTYAFNPFDGQLDYGGTSGKYVAYPITSTGQGTITSPAALAQFTGNSFADLYLNADGEVDLPYGLGGGNLIAAGLLSAGVDLTVQYEYTAVPEVSTWFGAAAAIVGLAFGFRPARQKLS